MLLCTRGVVQLLVCTWARHGVAELQSSAYIYGAQVARLYITPGLQLHAGANRPMYMCLIAGHYSSVQKERQACAISLIQADTLPEGFNWGQLPNLAGGLYLV